MTPLPIDYLECARMNIHGNSVARDNTLYVRLDDVDAVIDTLKRERVRGGSVPSPPSGYIITEDELNDAEAFGLHPDSPMVKTIRSRELPTCDSMACCEHCNKTDCWYLKAHDNQIRNASKQEEFERVTTAWKEWMMLHVPAPTYHKGLDEIESLSKEAQQQ